MAVGSVQIAVTSTLDFKPAQSKELLDVQGIIQCGFTLKCMPDMRRTYSQMHCTDKYSKKKLNHLDTLAKWSSVC